jgi:hypothetical protein
MTTAEERAWAAIDRLTEKQAETDRQLKETDRLLKESKAEHDRLIQERRAEYDRRQQDIDRQMKNLRIELGGIGNSNGAFAEEYFYNCFDRGEQTFFGEKFDDIEKNIKLPGKLRGTVKAEYDIVLLNGKSVGIVEVKYKARKDYIPKLIGQAETFRLDFPDYASHRIFLALAALSFEDEVEDDCIREGIAIIKQAGDTVVINDKHLKVF